METWPSAAWRPKTSEIPESPGVYRFLDEDVTVIILSNTGTTDLDEFVAQIGKKVVG